VSGITQDLALSGLRVRRTLARRDDIRSVADQPEGGSRPPRKRRGGSLIALWKPASTSLIPLTSTLKGAAKS